MKDEILDDGFGPKSEIRNKEDIKKYLTQAGIHSFFEHKNGTIIVDEGDAVRVAIHYKNNVMSVKPIFPRIGNSIQILFSAIFLAIFIFIIPVEFPLPWVIAIVGGQIVSYFIHTPKTKRLKERIEQI